MKERLSDVASFFRRVGLKVFPALALLTVAIAIPFAAIEAYVYAVSSPYFAVAQIDVEGLEMVERQSFLKDVQLVEGMNIFDVDVERVELLGESLDWVADVRVERALPDRVEIKVTERQVAAVLIDEDYLLVEKTGEIFKELDAADPVNLVLERPLMTGLNAEDLKTDAGKSRFKDGLAAVTQYQAMDLSKNHPISEVHIDPVMGISMVTADGIGTEIRLGTGMIGQRLKRLAVVFRSLDEDELEADYILIDHEENLDRVVVGTRSFASKDASGESGDNAKR